MHDTLNRIYDAMPASIQHLLCTAEGYRVRFGRYSRGFDRDLSRAIARTWATDAEVLRYRNQRLKSFLTEAVEAPFYRHVAYGARSLPSLEAFPILDKAIVQADAPRISRVGERVAQIAHTSGSTGAGLRFPVTAASIRQQYATWWRYRQWHGLHRGVWCAYFGGRSVVPAASRRPPFWRYNAAGRQVFFSAYHLRPDTWRAYVAELQRRKLPWLHGYPSVLALLAAYLIEHRETLGYEVRCITVGAETLLPSQSDAMESAFGIRPRQSYGMAEGVANASECPAGRLHLDEDYAYVEFLPLGAGPRHRIVGTNFTNSAFPLIRYDVGDIAHISGQTCDCGRPGRIIDRIEGRREDYVLLPDGALIGRLDHIFKDQVRVREAQIYQPDRRHVVLRVVRREDFSPPDEAALLREARLRLGGDIEIDLEYMDALPRTASGKLRFVVSDLLASAIDRPSVSTL